MAGMPDPTERLHPLMHAMVEGGYYQPSALRPPVRNDSTYVGPDFQRFQSPELKASGFFGDMNRGVGPTVSEYSLGGLPPAPYRQPPAGQGFTYPSLYPGITKQGMTDVVNAAARNTQVPEYVEQGARASAQDRMSQGKSPFWNPQQDYLFQGLR